METHKVHWNVTSPPVAQRDQYTGSCYDMSHIGQTTYLYPLMSSISRRRHNKHNRRYSQQVVKTSFVYFAREMRRGGQHDTQPE
jgi:hypothetical protein